MEVENTDVAQNATAEPMTTDDTNVPSLKSICVKAIDNFGSVPWHIIKLVLEDKRCTPEILRRLENQSPHLKEQDQDIWRKFFFEKYPKKLDAFHNGEFAGTSDWRRVYDESARNDKDKFALAALRLRESKERKTAEKRERELQRTDKAPPPKRARWGETIPTRPKSLLEKARSQTMKATAVYRIGPSSRSNSILAPSSLARGSVSAKHPAVVRRPSTSSTISTASSSTAVSDASSTSSRIAHLGSRIPSAKSPSKSLSLDSNNAGPLGSSPSTPIGRPPILAGSITEDIAEGSSSDPPNLQSLISSVSSTPVNVNGHFCDVFQGVHSIAGKIALKRPRISGAEYDGDVTKRFEREAATWRDLRHPHILEFLGTLKRDGHLYLVSPFINNGTMVEYLFRHPNVKRIRLLREMADAIQYLHTQNVVHGDIKATNTLISDDAHVLLCDFGLTKMIDSRTSTCVKGAGSVRWMSPELWDNEPRTFQSDVYAFGMTIAEVLTGQAPFPHLLTSMAVMMAVIGRNERPSKDPASSPDGESYEEAWNVGAACWPTNPSERITMAEAHRRLSTEYAASR